MQPFSATRQRSMALSPLVTATTPVRPESPSARKSNKAQTNEACAKIWEQAEANFLAKTNQKLNKARGKDLKQILQDFRDKYENVNSTEDYKKRQKAEKAIENTLQCIMLVGGLVAQGASMVFAPANLCFSAIQFLIETPKRIKKADENIVMLFFEIESFMMTFGIYDSIERMKQELHHDIVINAARLMACVVDAVALAIQLTSSKWEKTKRTSKLVLFDDDSGMAEILKRFTDLVERQKQVTHAVTLKEVLETKQEMRDQLFDQSKRLKDLNANMGDALNILRELGTDATDRKAERAISDRRRQIAKKLSAYGNVTAEVGRMADLLAKAGFELRGEDSCQWVFKTEDYQAWLNSSPQKRRILALSGDTQTGKSVLCAAILKRWPSQDQVKAGGSQAVAYYAFEKEDNKSSRDTSLGKEQVQTALKCMAMQLADQHIEYAKALHENCGDDKGDSYFQDTKLHSLWQKLKLSFCEPRGKCNFLLVFDGVDALRANKDRNELIQLLKSEASKAFENPKRVPWMLVTGATSSISTYQLPSIFPEDHNSSDIELYVSRYLQDKRAFVGDQSELSKVLKLIKKDLPTSVDGDFGVAKKRLDLIQRAIEADFTYKKIKEMIKDGVTDDPDLYRTTLDDVSVDSKAAKDHLKDISQILDEKSILELNELLLWSVWGCRWLNMDELEAAWFLRFQRKPPVQSLRSKIGSKYQQVFEEDDRLAIVNDQFFDYFRDQDMLVPDEEKTKGLEGVKISINITVEQNKKARHKKFTWILDETNPRDDPPMPIDINATLNAKSEVEVNALDANYWIALCCLRLLGQSPNKRTSALILYAQMHLPCHLKWLNERKDQLELGAKRAIAKGLVDFLVDVEAGEKHWSATSVMNEVWQDEWVFNTIRSWLDYARANKELEPREKRWVDHVAKESKESNRAALWKPITIMVAKQWLQKREWDPGAAYEWVDGYIALQERRDNWYDNPWADEDENMSDDEDSDEEDSHVSTPIEGSQIGETENNDSIHPDESEARKPEDNGSIRSNGSQAGATEDKINPDAEDHDNEKETPVKALEATQNEKEPSIKSEKDDKDDDSVSRISSISTLSSLRNRNERLIKQVEDAAKWACEFAGVEKNSTYFERLGATYLHLDVLDNASQCFESAKSLKPSHWTVLEGLARVCRARWDHEKAAEYMEEAIKEVREWLNTNSASNEGFMSKKDQLTDYLSLLAECHSDLEQFELAQQYWDEVVSRDRSKPVNMWNVAKNLWSTGGKKEQTDEKGYRSLEKIRARETVLAMAREVSKEEKLSHLARTCSSMADDNFIGFDDFLILLYICHGDESSTLLHAVQDAVAHWDDKDSFDAQQFVCLHLFEGMAASFRSTDKYQMNNALKSWQETVNLASQGDYDGATWPKRDAINYMNIIHFNLVMNMPKTNEEDIEAHLDFFRNNRTFQSQLTNSTFEGSYYAHFGQPRRALGIFLDDIIDALNILSDDDPENDEHAFFVLCQIFVHINDYSNLLSAWALRGSYERRLDFDSDSDDSMSNTEPDGETQNSKHLTTEKFIEPDHIPPHSDQGVVTGIGVLKEQTAETNGVHETIPDTSAEAEHKSNENPHSPRGSVSSASERILAGPRNRPSVRKLRCDGVCKNDRTFGDEHWLCKYCPNCIFCAECKEKLRKGTLDRFICSPQHDWFHIPPMTEEEYAQFEKPVLKRLRSKPDSLAQESKDMKQVWLDLQIIDGKRIGRIGTIEEWMDKIREIWNISEEDGKMINGAIGSPLSPIVSVGT